MARQKVLEEPVCYLPPDWDPTDAGAIQALARGDATKEQQQRALNWIIYGAANTYDLEYRTDPRAHAFVSGRRFVGLQIVKLIKLKLGALGVNQGTGVDPFKKEVASTTIKEE